MNTFKLIIASPDGNKFDDEVEMLVVRGISGELAVLAGHIPFVTTLQPCDCKIVLSDGSEKIGTTDGGLLTVSAEKTTLMSGSFSWK
ncbi:MAG: F0F1 ATP synthase subunit epsilon [Ruminococcus sp.]|nr:F0F1 ATP synthase subunit epsilon [Candidatus Copronaster equi]